MKIFTFIVLAIAAGGTVLLVVSLKPVSTAAFLGFAIWLILPHIIMSIVLLLFRCSDKESIYRCFAALVVTAIGIIFLMDVIFWHPDAQGAIAMLMTPFFQGAALVLSIPIVRFLSRKT